jgi:CRP/FNR family cyclic AMP-dependent transcriptional regulator
MKTILLIEDTPSILENLTEYLELEGYRILGACDGKTGVEMAVILKPDLIICDMLMRDMDGKEVLCKLMASPQTASIPFIFSTSMSEKGNEKEALELGADVYLVKPFQTELLMESIITCLNKGKQRHQELSAVFS